MGLTYFYAQVFGVALTAIGIGFFLNRRQMLEIVREVIDDRALLFIIGIITTILGSIFVLTDNIWNGGFLATVTTVIGWIILLRGILLIWLPHGTVRRIFKAIQFEQSYYAIALLVLVVGIYLVYCGFFTIPNYAAA